MNGKMTTRAETRQVRCGRVPIGGGAPVSVQSMTNTNTEDSDATAVQIAALADAGADIVRLAAPTRKAALAIKEIKSKLSDEGWTVPIVADIHFDHRIALAAIEAGADKIRINPGNIGGIEQLKIVADAAGKAGIPIRIGVNSGSVEQDLLGLYKEKPAEALAESALKNIELVRNTGFEDIVVSIKSSDVIINTEAHMILAENTNLPLHIGITEAGFGEAGIIKSAAGIGALLAYGIGDTIRVSLTGDPIYEIPAARNVLRALNLLPGGVSIISCPTCGRCKVDLTSICKEVSDALLEIELKRTKAAKDKILTPEYKKQNEISTIKIAIMGCSINGPGEASDADLGVACGSDGGIYFEKGVKTGKISYDEITQKIIDRVKELYFI
jgi:(E)-4-hydroxy-3-methylbut-2-enyl-diphosphate synthase